MLTATVVGLLVLAVAALATHDEGGSTRVSASQSPAPAHGSGPLPDVDGSAEETTTTTTTFLAETTLVPTTGGGATPVTTAVRAPTTGAAPPPTTSLPTSSTVRPGPVPTSPNLPTTDGPIMTVTPGQGLRVYTVSGTYCTGANAGVGVLQYNASGQQINGDGAQAMPNGTWSIPVNVPAGEPAGTITFKGYCVNSVTNVKYFDYYPQTVTVS